jgi:hypothetical protein
MSGAQRKGGGAKAKPKATKKAPPSRSTAGEVAWVSGSPTAVEAPGLH